MSNNNRQYQPPGSLPAEGSIQEGKVARIESYGAFVDLDNFHRLRGLIHISQLMNQKVDQVQDVVDVDDRVWVKVLSVTSEVDPASGRTRHKIGLSLKDVSQDGECIDHGAQRERQDALKNQISQNLQSSIGMGVALDPMAASRNNNSNLILKHKRPDPTQTVINGYALVADDDEATMPPPAKPQEQQQQPTVSATDTTKPAVGPRGRGRGTTLPAWMTRQQQQPPPPDGPTKKETNNNQDDDDDSSHSSHRKSKKRKHKDKKKRSSKKHKKHHRKSKRSRRRSRSPSYSSEEPSSVDSRSVSPPSRRRRRDRRDRSEERSGRRRKRDDRSSSRSPSRGRERSRHRKRRSRSRSPSGHQFESLEDAQRVIEQLEAKKRQQQK